MQPFSSTLLISQFLKMWRQYLPLVVEVAKTCTNACFRSFLTYQQLQLHSTTCELHSDCSSSLQLWTLPRLLTLSLCLPFYSHHSVWMKWKTKNTTLFSKGSLVFLLHVQSHPLTTLFSCPSAFQNILEHFTDKITHLHNFKKTATTACNFSQAEISNCVINAGHSH